MSLPYMIYLSSILVSTDNVYCTIDITQLQRPLKLCDITRITTLEFNGKKKELTCMVSSSKVAFNLSVHS